MTVIYKLRNRIPETNQLSQQLRPIKLNNKRTKVGNQK